MQKGLGFDVMGSALCIFSFLLGSEAKIGSSVFQRQLGVVGKQ